MAAAAAAAAARQSASPALSRFSPLANPHHQKTMVANVWVPPKLEQLIHEQDLRKSCTPELHNGMATDRLCCEFWEETEAWKNRRFPLLQHSSRTDPPKRPANRRALAVNRARLCSVSMRTTMWLVSHHCPPPPVASCATSTWAIPTNHQNLSIFSLNHRPSWPSTSTLTTL